MDVLNGKRAEVVSIAARSPPCCVSESWRSITSTGRVFMAGKEVHLNHGEYTMLYCMANRPGQVHSCSCSRHSTARPAPLPAGSPARASAKTDRGNSTLPWNVGCFISRFPPSVILQSLPQFVQSLCGWRADGAADFPTRLPISPSAIAATKRRIKICCSCSGRLAKAPATSSSRICRS